MSELREKVARAVHDMLYQDGSSDAWMSGKCPLDSVTISGDVDLLRAADAAIAAVLGAMQEPSEGMLDEMHGRVRILVDPGQRSADIQNDREVWKAMLAIFRKEQLGDSQAGDTLPL